MKHTFLLALLTLSMGVCATEPFIVSPDEGLAEPKIIAVSTDMHYLAGIDEATKFPVIWNTKGRTLDILEYDGGDQVYFGTFNDINSAGLAVGQLTNEFTNTSQAILATAGHMDDFTLLYQGEGELSSEACGISEDGKTIVGYYRADEFSIQACLWSADKRIDLENPTSEALGFKAVGTKARWISGDAHIIGGSTTDDATGFPVLITWLLTDGQYKVQTPSKNFYHKDAYIGFQPLSMSRSGEWVLLEAKAADADMPHAARLNLTTGQLQLYPGDEFRVTMFAIANDGTAVGDLNVPLIMGGDDLPTSRIWPANATNMLTLSDLYPDSEYLQAQTAHQLSAISADARYIFGYAGDEDGVYTGFYTQRIEDPDEKNVGRFIISPMVDVDITTEVNFFGEKMSRNRRYVVGTDRWLNIPEIWDVENDALQMLVVTDKNIITQQLIPREGTLHSVTDQGIAVGGYKNATDFTIIPIVYDAQQDTLFELEAPLVEGGGAEAYDISADGQTIVGFYFDAGYKGQACIWTGKDHQRTDLVVPTEEEVGFLVDYVAARWISDDARRIVGYAQEGYSGNWTLVIWNLDTNTGKYVPDGSITRRYYQQRPYDETPKGIVYHEIKDPKPYELFEPQALSRNGRWITLMVCPTIIGEPDWMNLHADAARLNIETGQLEVLTLRELEEQAPVFFGVADDGTAAGRLEENGSTSATAVVWGVGEPRDVPLVKLFGEDDYFAEQLYSGLSYISPTGRYVVGFGQDESAYVSTFIVKCPLDLHSDPEGIEDIVVDADVRKQFHRGQLLIIRDGIRYDILGRVIR